MKQAIKGIVLPAPGPRRLRVGLGRGVRMHIDFAHLTRLYLGLYEIELNRHLRRMLKPGMTAFDVGGQHGYDALVIAKHTKARVASFECDSEQIAQMRKTFDMNPDLRDVLEPVEAMVGDGDGQLGLDAYAYSESGFVPDFIKCDIEGGELAALQSAERILSERRPALIVEVHSAELDRRCGRILVEHGYEPTIVNQRRIWPDQRPTAFNRWLVAPEPSA